MTRLLKKLYGTGVIAWHIPFQKGIDRLPVTHLHRIRDRRIRRLVGHAARHVPYYRDLFRQQGIDPRDIRTADDLAQLPLLDKQAVRDNPEAFVSETGQGRSAIPFKTSGSTGTPLTIYHDRRSLLANMARTLPEKAVIWEALGNRSPRQVKILYSSSTVKKIWEIYRDLSLRLPSLPPLLELGDPIEHNIGEINRLKPDILSSYGSYMEVIFRVADARQITIHRPGVVVYGADAMSEGGRRLIEEKFGVRVFSRYAAVESFRIGFTCAHRSGFHIREDLCSLQVVDDEGKRVRNGVPGEVVITNLVNRGTVLINYRIGDLGALSGEHCACGRTLPVLAQLEGRTEDIIHLEDGRMVHPRTVWSVFKERNDVLGYQLIQHQPNRFELKIVPAGNRVDGQVDGSILEALEKLIGPAKITISIHAELSTDGRKFRPVITRCGSARGS
ncbi:MAG: hypothetical protein WCH04_12930 [Gammaproteobacteria bacterium]